MEHIRVQPLPLSSLASFLLVKIFIEKEISSGLAQESKTHRLVSREPSITEIMSSLNWKVPESKFPSHASEATVSSHNQIIIYSPKLRSVSLSTEFDSNAHSATSRLDTLRNYLNLSEPVS